MPVQQILKNVSYEVEYAGRVYRNARFINGGWYFVDPTTSELHRFRLQNCISVVAQPNEA